MGFELKGPNLELASAQRLAITISYSQNHSILWAIIDGILSWLYVVYFGFFADDFAEAEAGPSWEGQSSKTNAVHGSVANL